MGWSKTLTHKLTDSWTPDKAINNLITIMTHSYAMYPTMPLQCSVHRGFGDQVKLWLFVCIQYIKGSALSIPSILAIKPQVMLMLIHSNCQNFKLPLLGQMMDSRA